MKAINQISQEGKEVLDNTVYNQDDLIEEQIFEHFGMIY